MMTPLARTIASLNAERAALGLVLDAAIKAASSADLRVTSIDAVIAAADILMARNREISAEIAALLTDGLS